MNRTPAFIFILSSLFIMFADYFGLLQIVKGPIGISIVPVRERIYQTRIFLRDLSYVITSYHMLSSVLSDNKKLQLENTQLQLKVQSLGDENSQMRVQLGAPLPSSFQFIPARVLSVTRYMEIGIGQNDGVKVGMPVVAENVFIGKIISVDAYRSRVILVNDAELAVQAITSRGTAGSVSGQYGGGVLMDKILQKDQLFLDDEVSTSGTDDIPPALLIGKIIHINSDDAAAYKKAKVEPAIDIKTIKTVFVISAR